MISGLVVQLSPDERLAALAIEAMGADATIQTGQRHGCRMPIVLESHGSVDAQARTDWLSRLPGVIHVDVTFVDFEERAEGELEVEHEHV